MYNSYSVYFCLDFDIMVLINIMISLLFLLCWGCRLVTNTKRIMISLPQNLLQEVDGVAQKEKSNRSELIREAMKLYLQERKKRFIRESMQKGYMEMANINLNLASESFLLEEEADSTLDRLVSGV